MYNKYTKKRKLYDLLFVISSALTIVSFFISRTIKDGYILRNTEEIFGFISYLFLLLDAIILKIGIRFSDKEDYEEKNNN